MQKKQKENMRKTFTMIQINTTLFKNLMQLQGYTSISLAKTTHVSEAFVTNLMHNTCENTPENNFTFGIICNKMNISQKSIQKNTQIY